MAPKIIPKGTTDSKCGAISRDPDLNISNLEDINKKNYSNIFVDIIYIVKNIHEYFNL